MCSSKGLHTNTQVMGIYVNLEVREDFLEKLKVESDIFVSQAKRAGWKEEVLLRDRLWHSEAWLCYLAAIRPLMRYFSCHVETRMATIHIGFRGFIFF